MGALDFYGNDSDGNYEICFRMILEADGTHTTDAKPTRMAFYTTPSGSDTATERLRITNAGHVSIVGDNQKLLIGSNDDIQIYHDGSKSLITDSGTGWLEINTNNLRLENAAANETILYATENGSVDLYYDNTKRFETVSNGTTNNWSYLVKWNEWWF